MAPSAANHGDTWLVFVDTGKIWHVTNGIEAVTLEASGWKAFPTEAAAKAFAKESVPKRVVGNVPGGSSAEGALSGVDAIGDFFSRLSEANTWIRVGEFAAGTLLLYVGLKGLFPAQVASVSGKVKSAAGLAALA